MSTNLERCEAHSPLVAVVLEYPKQLFRPVDYVDDRQSAEGRQRKHPSHLDLSRAKLVPVFERTF